MGALDTTAVRIGLDGRSFLSARKVRLLLAASTPSQGGAINRLDEPTTLKIKVGASSGSFSSYHVYSGGREFRPVLPGTRLSPGASARISLEMPPLISFISGIPPFELVNRDFTRWVSDRVFVKSLRLECDCLKIVVRQDNQFADVRRFELSANVDKYPGRSDQYGGAYLQCHLTDYIGRHFPIRVRHNGVQPPELQVDRGAGFETVTLVSYDGFRLLIRYGVHGTISTVYLAEPSELGYELKPPSPYFGGLSQPSERHVQ